MCVCSDGYAGVRCEQPPAAFDLVESSWDLAATPATTTQLSQSMTELGDTEAPPTLQPWQLKPGQRLVEIQWEELQVCVCACVSGRHIHNQFRAIYLFIMTTIILFLRISDH